MDSLNIELRHDLLDGQAEQAEVYFDDFEVTHTYSNVVVAYDYYPYGLPMENRKLEREQTRHNYQGEYAEKDKETGYFAFQLRFYDARIGRWVSPDPYGQYASPYVGMGNLGHISSDPDGGWSWATAAAGAAIGGTVGAMYGLATDPDNWGWYAAGGVVGGGVVGGVSFDGGSASNTLGNSAKNVNNAYTVGGAQSLSFNIDGFMTSLNGASGLLRGYEQGINEEFYYNALDGLELPNGKVLSKSDFDLTFNSSYRGNATYHGFENGRFKINFDISDYEVTVNNLRVLAIHEVHGHGILKISGFRNKGHYKAYFVAMDSKYWGATTEKFKSHYVDQAYSSWWSTEKKMVMPKKYEMLYQKHHKW